jgi:hypothetical protein
LSIVPAEAAAALKTVDRLTELTADPGTEGGSLRNVNRGDKTPVELFFHEIVTLDPQISRLILAA